MLFDKLDIEPAKSPAVLDTETWDRTTAGQEILAFRKEWVSSYEATFQNARTVPASDGAPKIHSLLVRDGQVFILAVLPDEQKVFLQIGEADHDEPMGSPFYRMSLSEEKTLKAYPTDADVIDRFCRSLHPRNAPRRLGQTPRLGIGTRMTTKVWPGIFSAMRRKGFAANSIQNSVRELNLLEDLLSGSEPVRNYAGGFGMIESGYTGSTFEGLWVAGVLAALEYDEPIDYGTDADHIQMKRTDVGLANAKRVIRAARFYNFFTLDVADILSYGTASTTRENENPPNGSKLDEKQRAEILSYHREPARIDGKPYAISSDLLERCIDKYRQALESTAILSSFISGLRPEGSFDLEFAFDEHPPEVRGPDCISSEAEVVFVARELIRRGLPVTHLAPNFGIEKGFDYRLSDGCSGLEQRVRKIQQIAEDMGFMLDVHSADDLSVQTRRAIGRATGGKLHFKISPVLHHIFSVTVYDFYPDIFKLWWDDALGYAVTEAGKGSPAAAECLSILRDADDPSPSPEHEIFRQFFFAFPGRRDSSGRFVNREMFYSLSDEFYSTYQDRVATHLSELSDNLFCT